MHSLAGTVIADRYRVERELGSGGMATVWCARDLRHDRLVAIKVLRPQLAGAIGVDRFVREVRVTAQLQHPNIVPVIDSGVLTTPDGTSLPWYAMAYLEGESLRARIARGHQLPVDEALRITECVGLALHAAHRQGIIHRDIKPENIFLSNGNVYVVDFGIARALMDTGAEERLTGTGLAIGTTTYMSPEQATADVVDARSDQYSLAATLYEMLVGEPPFTGISAQTIIARRLSQPARPIRPVRSTVPQHVDNAILKALERAPADRFADVQAFTDALLARSHADIPSPQPSRDRRRVLLSVAVIAVIAAAWFVAPRVRSARTQPADPQVAALYARGMRAYNQRTATGIAEAISAFSAAIARDSSFAPAWAGLGQSYARAYARGFRVGNLAPESIIQKALAAADRALINDSTNSDAWVTLAMANRIVDPTDYSAVIRYSRRGISEDSSNAAAWQNLGITLADMGDLSGATQAWRRCIRLAPGYGECLAFLALANYWRRQYDSALFWADSAVSAAPTYILARHAMGGIAVELGDYVRAAASYDAAARLDSGVEYVNALAGRAITEARAGRANDAREILKHAKSLTRDYTRMPAHTATWLAGAHAALGERDAAIELLAAYDPRRDLHFQLHLRCEPPFDPLRGDPRFVSLLVTAQPPPGGGC